MLVRVLVRRRTSSAWCEEMGYLLFPPKLEAGIWRDACEQVALGLDNGQQNHWYKWLVYLFGERLALPQGIRPALAQGPITEAPKPAALSVRAANKPASLRQAIAHRPEVKQALTNKYIGKIIFIFIE